MSRLDSFIRRMEAQRAALGWAAERVADIGGPVFEFGLGNGRTYDHLRTILPGRAIYVFDRRITAHPDCIPPENLMLLGEFSATLPQAARTHAGAGALIHADIGSGDKAASLALAAWAAPFWAEMLRSGGLLLSDQPVTTAGLETVELPLAAARRYHVLRRL